MRKLSFAVLLLAAHASPLGAQETGTVRGRVTDPSGRPIAAVRVSAGAAARTATDAEGRYALTLPARAAQIRATRVGFEAGERRVAVPPGGEAELDITLRASDIQLDDFPVWNPDTLDQRGAAMYADTPDAALRASAESFTELLAGRVPGVVARRLSGSVGAASRIELRGVDAASLRRQPLLVYDGIRTISEETPLDVDLSGTTVSGYDDLDPDFVEGVLVLPGPASAARYGPAGGNGVLEVGAPMGRVNGAADTRWRAFAEAGVRDDPGGYPLNYTRVGRTPQGQRVGNCFLLALDAGFCTAVADSLRAFSPLNAGSAFRAGSRLGAGFAVEGERGMSLSYSAGAVARRALGVLDENGEERIGVRAAVRLVPLRFTVVRVTAAHLRRDADLLLEGNTALVPVAAGLLGGAREVNGGYSPAYPRGVDLTDATQETRRTLAGVEAGTWPVGWLRVSGRFGIDRVDRDERLVARPVPPADGERSETVETGRELRTGAVEAEARFNFGTRLGSRTFLGVERISEHSDRSILEITPFGDIFESGSNVRRVTLGIYARQAVRVGKLTVDALARRDEPRRQRDLWSASVDAAYELRPDFPRRPGARLRAAWGHAERSIDATPGIDAPVGFTFPCGALKECDGPAPQKSDELEAGADFGLLGRAEARLTAYRRDEKDVLVVEATPAGPVFPPGTRVRNTGVEAALRARLLERGSMEWEVEVLGWANRNRVTERPGVPVAVFPGQRVQEGYPLGAYFARPIVSWDDRDDNGILGFAGCPGPECEVQVGDTLEYAGSPVPTRMVAVATRLRLWERVTLSARLEHQGGARLYNLIGEVRCTNSRGCREAVDPATPLARQARVVAAQIGGSPAAFIEDADFVKLREVAVTFSAPERWGRRIGAAGVEVTVAGRNLVTWTDYTGTDPEVNTIAYSPFAAADLGSQPLPRTVTTRVEVRF